MAGFRWKLVMPKANSKAERAPMRQPGGQPWSAAEQMQVEVKHGLPGVGVRVDHGAVARFGDPLALRDLGRERARAARRSAASFASLSVATCSRGTIEHMQGRLRIDVAERDALRRLRDELRRDLAAHDAAEQTVVSHRTAPWLRTSAARTMRERRDRRRSRSGACAARACTRTNPRRAARSLARLDPPSGPTAQRDRRVDATVPQAARRRVEQPARASGARRDGAIGRRVGIDRRQPRAAGLLERADHPRAHLRLRTRPLAARRHARRATKTHRLPARDAEAPSPSRPASSMRSRSAIGTRRWIARQRRRRDRADRRRPSPALCRAHELP